VFSSEPRELATPAREEVSEKVLALRTEMRVCGLEPATPGFRAEPAVPCPACKATCTVKLGGVGVLCNQCGHSWDGPLIPAPPNRNDVLSGRIGAKLRRL